ncbi:MAG TPA: histidine phosphotransferase family protein, partial [Methyloceanibacter sp.]|nr:histidine phosphotransferase family protein [Methyloceanibacter sp.]
MTEPTAIGDLELAALVSSRICHDVINPISAIANGLELLDEEPDEAMREAAMDLIRKSTAQASAKLQFARLAFGAGGSAGAEIDLGDAESVARGFLEDDKTSLNWQLVRILLPKNRVKLLLNMLVVAATTIPRGGSITAEPIGEGAADGFRVTTTGTNARVPAAAPALLSATLEGSVDAHGIQPFYTGLLAR